LNNTERKSMKKLLALAATIVALGTTTASADQASDINLCAKAVKAYTGKTVDPFGAQWKKNGLFSWGYVKWPGIHCRPLTTLGLSHIEELTVDGTVYIISGYAGTRAKAASEAIEATVDAEVAKLRQKISLLEAIGDDADDALKVAGVDVDEVIATVQTAVDKVN